MSATPCRMLVVTAVAAVLSLGIAPVAYADEAPTATCASQEAQVVKAEGALARLTALFEAQQDKGAEARVGKATKAKKAQLQRPAKAEARFAECRSAPAA